jgi:AmiR/NasT family two-component response regulator
MPELRILIADDDRDVRELLRTYVERLGHVLVAECEDGLQVVSQAQESKPDLMILDIKMPAMDGLEAARQVQNTWPCAILFLTGYVEEGLIEEAGEVGAIGYLVKPFRQEELKPAIEIAWRRFKELQSAGREVAELRAALETRKILDRAKAHLMNTKGMSEEEAFKTIHFGARNSGRTMRDVATEILRKAGDVV